MLKRQNEDLRLNITTVLLNLQHSSCINRIQVCSNEALERQGRRKIFRPVRQTFEDYVCTSLAQMTIESTQHNTLVTST